MRSSTVERDGWDVRLERLNAVCRLIWVFGILAGLTFVYPPAGVIAFALLVWKNVRGPSQASTTHGSARWANLKDLLNAGCLFDRAGVFLGHAAQVSPFSWWLRIWALFRLPWSRSSDAVAIAATVRKHSRPLAVTIPDSIPHVAVYGASGSGKSSSYAMQMLRRCSSSLICLDPKGELARNSARDRWGRIGHEICVIDPYGVATGCGFEPQGINVLDWQGGDDTRTVDNARRLANSLVLKSGQENEKFWTDSATTVVTAILSFLMTEAKEGCSLNTLRDITSNPQLMQQALNVMNQSDACYGLLKRLAGEVGGLEGKTRASVYAVTNSNLSFLDSVPVARTLATSTFDPHVILNGKATVYLCLPVDRIIEMAPFQRVILTTLINLVFAAGEDPDRRVQLLLDEGATLGQMDSLYQSVMFGRSFGLRSMWLFQTASQVERVFPDSQRSDFNGTVARVYCSADDLETAKEVSESCGQSTVMGMTQQSGVNAGQTGSTGIHDQTTSRNHGTSDSASFAETGRPLITPAEVMQLPRHLAIALLPHVPPILTVKVPYYLQTGRHRLRRWLHMAADVSFIAATLVVLLVSASVLANTVSRQELLALVAELRLSLLP